MVEESDESKVLNTNQKETDMRLIIILNFMAIFSNEQDTKIQNELLELVSYDIRSFNSDNGFVPSNVKEGDLSYT